MQRPKLRSINSLALTEEPAMRVGVTTMKVSSGVESRSAWSTKTATAIATVGKRSELDRAATARQKNGPVEGPFSLAILF